MDSYNNYKIARDKAWKNLIKYNVTSLPVDVFKMCRKAGVSVISYKSAIDVIKAHQFEKHLDNDGFTAKIDGGYYIFYNDTITPKSRIIFTIAHEMGHIALGHARTGVTIWNRGEQAEPAPEETQANIFASRLLAPACVIKEMDIHTAEELQEITGLSYTAAKIRLERLNQLRARDKFYLSPLEREVKSNFKRFIKNYQRKQV